MAWNVPTASPPPPPSRSGTRARIRFRISPAARSLKVMTRIEEAGTPASTSRLKRSAMTAVLPVPAPATTRCAPLPARLAASCSGESRISRTWSRLPGRSGSGSSSAGGRAAAG